MVDVPCIDIAPFLNGNARERQAVARQWGAAFEEIGFATIVGHGVDESTIGETYDAVMSFFSQPEPDKLRWAVPDRVKTRGYLPVGIESVARTRGDDRPPDLCEALVFHSINRELAGSLVGKVSDITGNLYPDQPLHLSSAVRTYFSAVHGLAGRLMELSACALDLPDDYFVPFIDRMRGTLRCVLYPNQVEEPEPGQLRYGAHSDYGGLTILRQDDAPGGLQACTKAGEWIDVKPVRGAYVINIGDLMARWTNDRWRSTLHRVMNPPRDARGSTARLSLVLFSGPNDDAVISCLPTCHDDRHPVKYPAVRARDYIQEKLSASMPAVLAENLQRAV